MSPRQTANDGRTTGERGRGREREPAEEPAREAAPRGEEPARKQSESARLTAGVAAQAGLRQIAELTGKQPEGVTSVEPGEGGWVVGVEMLEDRRVPSSADILAIYEVEVDADGALLAYQRVKRYPRGRGSDGEGA